MVSQYPIRPITEDEYNAFSGVHQQAFNAGPPSPDRRLRALAMMEFDRTLAVFDGAAMVGKAGAFSFRMRLPGALAPVAGVTMVGVLPSHRRRGILSSLMRRQLADIHERGEAVATLFASEAGIYGRFGYGRASWQASFTLRRGEGTLARTAPHDGRLRLRIAEPQSVRPELAKVFDTVLTRQPGFFARDDHWWNRMLTTSDDRPLRGVIAEDDAGPRGYALFFPRDSWDEQTFLPDGKLEVWELLATDPAANAALWGDLLSRDLVSEFRADLRPVDDPLVHQLADPRRVRAHVTDGLWARLVDVGEALTLRRYACPVDAVIEVEDEHCPWNRGRWRLAATAAPRAGEEGYPATCERTSAPADLSLDVDVLGAAYLGGTRLGAMAAAGLIAERRPGSVAALSAAMSWDPAPWCPVIF